jgi:L-aminopeptidase/D-esterase-like protein
MMIIARSVTFAMKAMTKVVLTAGVAFSLSAAAMAQTNISNTRDGNGNLVRRNVPINNTPPMINSTENNPPRRVKNLSPTADDISRMLGHRK